MAKLKPYKDGVYLWHYVPSLIAAAAFAIGFLVCTLWITFRMFRTRSWFFIPFIIGGIMEVLGYAARARCHDHTDQLGIYAIQSVLILIAPSLFAATIYMALSRLMRKLQAESHSIISARWLTRIFVTGDVLSFLVQSGGGALATNQKINPNIPKWIILVGLLIQIAFFGLFIVTTVIFHKRLRRWSPPTLMSGNINWFRSLVMLYSVSVLIMVRSVFRVIEYAVGFDGYLYRHEWTLYAFDSSLMVTTMVIWAIMYPGDLGRKNVVRKKLSAEEIPMYQSNVPYDPSARI